MNDSKAACTEGGSIELGRSHGRGMANFRSTSPRLWGARPGGSRQAANGQRHSLGSAHGRALAKRHGNWNSVFVRFTRWSKLGVWDAVVETLASLGPRPTRNRPSIRRLARVPTCRPRKRGNQKQEALGPSRGGFSTKIHLPPHKR